MKTANLPAPVKLIGRILKRYGEVNGALLTKGLGCSLIVGTIPLLLMLFVAGSRFVAYGVLAWAIVFLIFMRLMAEILLYAALLIREVAVPKVEDESPREGH